MCDCKYHWSRDHKAMCEGIDREREAESRKNLLRDALREQTGNPVLDDLARASILAGVVGDDPELMAVFMEETNTPTDGLKDE